MPLCTRWYFSNTINKLKLGTFWVFIAFQYNVISDRYFAWGFYEPDRVELSVIVPYFHVCNVWTHVFCWNYRAKVLSWPKNVLFLCWVCIYFVCVLKRVLKTINTFRYYSIIILYQFNDNICTDNIFVLYYSSNWINFYNNICEPINSMCVFFWK